MTGVAEVTGSVIGCEGVTGASRCDRDATGCDRGVSE